MDLFCSPTGTEVSVLRGAIKRNRNLWSSFLLMGCDCSSELTVSTHGSFCLRKWHQVIFHLSTIYLCLFQNVFEQEVGGRSSLILMRGQCVSSLLRELETHHDICWLHSGNLPPPTSWSPAGRLWGGATSAAMCTEMSGQDPNKTEGDPWILFIFCQKYWGYVSL